MKRYFSFLFILLLPLTIYGQVHELQKSLKVEQFQLENGLTVVLSENHDTPTIMGAVIVKAGSKNDPSDATGMAHYLEHMLFKGTKTLGTTDYASEKIYLDQIDSLYEVLGKTQDDETRNVIQQKINEASKLAGQFAIPNEFDQMLREIGSTGVNAFTSPDITAYHNEFPSNKIEEWLSIYSHRFKEPVFRLFQSELETVYEEKNRSEESFINHAVELFNKDFYKKHPYGTQTTIGTTEHLKNPSLKKMYEFFDTYYVANNMILCLIGDFDSEEIKPMITKYFSDWRSGDVPEFPEYIEDGFQKGESAQISISPVKAFVRGYRTPKYGGYDQMVFEIGMKILSNSQGSGLFDRLMDNGEFLMLQAENISFQDYGATVFFCVPKVLGQSFDRANQLLDETLECFTSGEFEDHLFEGAKNEWIKDFETSMENNEERAFKIGQVIAYNIDWDTYLDDIEKIKNLTKDELIKIAQKYFSQNHYSLYSKMGKYKPKVLDKPNYDPIIPKNNTHSKFYNEWKEITSNNKTTNIVSLKEEIDFIELNSQAILKMVKNPINDVFNLKIIWEVGEYEKPDLAILGRLMEFSSLEGESLYNFRNNLYALGTSMYWHVYDHQFILEVEGLDENLEESLSLIAQVFNNPVIDNFKKQMKVIGKQVKTNRRFAVKETQSLNIILREYALYGENSKYINQVPAKRYRKLKEKDFKAILASLNDYSFHVNYTGNSSVETVKNALKKFKIKKGNKSNINTPKPEANLAYDVYLIKNNNGLQSHINFVGTTQNLDKNNKDLLSRRAFNQYFGYDMSSILFQEIREFRSLAYSTYGLVTTARNQESKNTFLSYVGCQADKTPEALELLHSLIRNMPIKAERENIIYNSIKNQVENSNPGFRNYNSLYDQSILRGYDDNFYLALEKELDNFSFNDAINFYEEHIKNAPLRLTVIGNLKKFDKSILNKYGKVKRLKPKDIFTK